MAAANPRTVVVLNTGGPVLMPWLSSVAGVVEAWYPGEEDGAAIAAILFGDVDPSGHLPITFPYFQRSRRDRLGLTQWPGIDLTSTFSEGLDVGYRWYNATGTQPLFPFGFGLSYTGFSFGGLSVTPSSDGYSVTVDVTNTGSSPGTEVPQVYLTDPAAAGQPPAQLAAFSTVTLAPRPVQRGHPRRSGQRVPVVPRRRLDDRPRHLHDLGRRLLGEPAVVDDGHSSLSGPAEVSSESIPIGLAVRHTRRSSGTPVQGSGIVGDSARERVHDDTGRLRIDGRRRTGTEAGVAQHLAEQRPARRAVVVVFPHVGWLASRFGWGAPVRGGVAGEAVARLPGTEGDLAVVGVAVVAEVPVVGEGVVEQGVALRVVDAAEPGRLDAARSRGTSGRARAGCCRGRGRTGPPRRRCWRRCCPSPCRCGRPRPSCPCRSARCSALPAWGTLGLLLSCT